MIDVVFVFKQKTAYEMRISDWSSDVCSSDLLTQGHMQMKINYRVGQIVPSSNITMETEIPAMLTARHEVAPERFTFHSSRMRMRKVTKDELEAMDRQADRCAAELSDAQEIGRAPV